MAYRNDSFSEAEALVPEMGNRGGFIRLLTRTAKSSWSRTTPHEFEKWGSPIATRPQS
jgi:hypothetical protein